MPYKLLENYQTLFDGKKYEHRISTHGDCVASFLYEDLFDLALSPKLAAAITSQKSVLSTRNLATGKQARRGDGTFGARIPHLVAVSIPNFSVARTEIAAIEIGTEVKILAKAMRKQLDRVCTDLAKQVSEFKKHGGNPICVGIVGINYAPSYTSYEGRRPYKTGGKKGPHPLQEAAGAERDLVSRVGQEFNELIILRFAASNQKPFDFTWMNKTGTEALYASALVRISREYEARF